VTHSVVQGSGIRSALFILMEGDLHPLCSDYTSLSVPESSAATVQPEFAHVQEWACHNKMLVNLSKTEADFSLASF
jgi:hypothetical protein